MQASDGQHRGEEMEKAVGQVVDAIANNQAKKNKEGTREPRFTFNIPASLGAISASGTLVQIASAWTLDISYGGIGLLTEYKFKPKEIIYVDLESVIGRSFEIQIQIAHYKGVLAKTHRIGCKFIFGTSGGKENDKKSEGEVKEADKESEKIKGEDEGSE